VRRIRSAVREGVFEGQIPPHHPVSINKIHFLASEPHRLLDIGWLEDLTVRGFKQMQEGAGIPQDDAEKCDEGAASRAREKGMEWNGIEGNGNNPFSATDVAAERASAVFNSKNYFQPE
jgi:hypothetical protein